MVKGCLGYDIRYIGISKQIIFFRSQKGNNETPYYKEKIFEAKAGEPYWVLGAVFRRLITMKNFYLFLVQELVL